MPRLISVLRGFARTPQMLANVNEGISNATRVLNEKLTEISEGISNETRVVNEKLTAINEGISNERECSMRQLTEINEVLSNETQILNDTLTEMNEGISNETRILNETLTEIKLALESFNSPNGHVGGQHPADVRLQIKPLHGNDLFGAPAPVGVESGDPPENENLPALPFPEVDPGESDPVSAITATNEFELCARMLGALATGLISAHGRALLYSLIRIMKPSLVVEIGTYQAGTSKVICWALLAANENGCLHTVDPFGGDRAPGIVASWPAQLREFVRFFPVNSMEYFAALLESGKRADLIFVDGNHDYEFALFDIEAAARAISPGGFVIIDNTSQAGPFLAAQDFLKRRADWRECGGTSLAKGITDSPFEVRSTIPETDFCVLRAPATINFTGRPYTSGQLHWEGTFLKGIRLSVLDGAPGTLYVQCILRTFGHWTSLGEFPCKGSVEIEKPGEIAVELDFQLDDDAAAQAVRFTVEPWFVWVGSRPLAVASWRVT